MLGFDLLNFILFQPLKPGASPFPVPSLVQCKGCACGAVLKQDQFGSTWVTLDSHPEYITIFPLIQGALKTAFGLNASLSPFDILTSQVENAPAIISPILIPKLMKDLTVSQNKPGI